MKGENVVDDTVWVVKSHYPWPLPHVPVYEANKLLVVVRNPLDTVISWINLLQMNSHSAKSPFACELEHPGYFDWLLKETCTYIKNWTSSVMTVARLRKLPVLFLRFEDLKAEPEPQLKSLMSFLIGERDLRGTNAEKRIQEVLDLGGQATQAYSLKDTTRSNNVNLSRYTDAQLVWVKEQMADMLHFFGYAKLPHDPDNRTGIFSFDGSEETLVSQYYGFRA